MGQGGGRIGRHFFFLIEKKNQYCLSSLRDGTENHRILKNRAADLRGQKGRNREMVLMGTECQFVTVYDEEVLEMMVETSARPWECT